MRLGSTSGLAQAQRTKAEQIQAERERQLEEQRQSDLARVRTASSFQSPTGNIHCQSFGSSLSCSTDNDAFMVTLPSYGEAYSGEGIVAGGETLPYGASWSGGDGFRCTSAENGITCYNNSIPQTYGSKSAERAFLCGLWGNVFLGIWGNGFREQGGRQEFKFGS